MAERKRPRQASSSSSVTSSTTSTDTSSTSSTSRSTSSISTVTSTPTPTSMESSTSSEPTSSSTSSSSSSSTPPSSSSSSSEPPESSSSSSSPPPPSSSSRPPESSSVPSSSSRSSSSSSTNPSSSASSSSTRPNSSFSPTSTLTPLPSSFVPSTNSITSNSSIQSLTTQTTLVDGQLTTVVGPIPTSLSPSPNQKSSSKRNAAIAGATTAAVLFILLILAVTFIYRRHRRKLHERLQTLLHPRKNTREGRGLLEGEDFFDEDEGALAMRAYRDANRAPSSSSQNTLGAPMGITSRATTPGGIEPLQVREAEAGSGLGGIVDDVMGPFTSERQNKDGHVAGASASTTTSTPGGESGYTGLPLAAVPSNPSIYHDPFRPNASLPGPGVTGSGNNYDQSVYYALPTSQHDVDLPPGAAPPTRSVYRPGTGPVGRAVEGLVRQFSSSGRK